MKPVYFDYNASTPMEPAVVDAMLAYATDQQAFGNPSLIHWAGAGGKKHLELARQQVAEFLNAGADEVYFTSGGTESNNHAIKGVVQNALTRTGPRPHIITSTIEHPSVRQVCNAVHADLQAQVTTVPVDSEGRVDVDDIKNTITDRTCLISIMHANNEFGTLQPINAIGAMARERDILLHVDAVCSAGKADIDVRKMNADLLSISGHKIYAPKGIGALYISERIKSKINPLIHGAGQQSGLRSGTDNVMLAVGLGQACEVSKTRDTDNYRQRLHALTAYFREQLQSVFKDKVEYNGCSAEQGRLCNTLNVSFLGNSGYELLQKIGAEIAFTAGDACSHSVAMLGKSAAHAAGAVRFSLGKSSDKAEVDYAVELFSRTCR